jgi:hypothetical protein
MPEPTLSDTTDIQDLGGNVRRISLVALVALTVVASSAWAADDGQTQPRLSSAGLIYANSSADVIATTNGAGNVKGVLCHFANGSNGVINIFVNGGSAQALSMNASEYPADYNNENFSGWLPLNVRFTSSIRVQLNKPVGSGTGNFSCLVSWALD